MHQIGTGGSGNPRGPQIRLQADRSNPHAISASIHDAHPNQHSQTTIPPPCFMHHLPPTTPSSVIDLHFTYRRGAGGGGMGRRRLRGRRVPAAGRGMSALLAASSCWTVRWVTWVRKRRTSRLPMDRWMQCHAIELGQLKYPRQEGQSNRSSPSGGVSPHHPPPESVFCLLLLLFSSPTSLPSWGVCCEASIRC